MVLKCILAAVIGYLLGNVPSGVLIAKGYGIADIRKHGSGNTGTTNVLRTLGWLPSVLTLVCDCLKGYVACLIGRWLGGDPGIHSARWAGEHGNDDANNDKLLMQMQDVPEDERTARFHSTVVLITRDEDGEEILAGNGDCEGTIAYDRRGTNGFGYDPLFNLADIPGKRMAELEPEEKNAISHRRRALDDLVDKLG